MINLPAYDESHERMLRSHLSLIHGVYVNDVKTVEGLIECHEDQHAEPDYHFQLRHTHDAEPEAEELEVWDGW